MPLLCLRDEKGALQGPDPGRSRGDSEQGRLVWASGAVPLPLELLQPLCEAGLGLPHPMQQPLFKACQLMPGAEGLLGHQVLTGLHSVARCGEQVPPWSTVPARGLP